MSDKIEGLTEAEYQSQIRRLGLHPTEHKTDNHTVHVTNDGNGMSIPDADSLTPEQRRATINKIKVRLGIGWP